MPDLVLQLDGIGVPLGGSVPHAQAAHWPHTRVVPFAARLPYCSLCNDRGRGQDNSSRFEDVPSLRSPAAICRRSRTSAGSNAAR
jgi:hypothetical protein